MTQVIDPYAVAESARSVSLETIIETGRHLPADAVAIDPSNVDDETVQDEIDRLDRELSNEYLRMSKAAEAEEVGDTQLTPQEELRLERLMETRNRIEALRIMGLELSVISDN